MNGKCASLQALFIILVLDIVVVSKINIPLCFVYTYITNFIGSLCLQGLCLQKDKCVGTKQ